MSLFSRKMPAPSIRVIDLITTDTNRKFEPAGRMAEAIIALTIKNDECTREDLRKLGFTAEEIDAQEHMARSLANIEIKLNKI